VTVLRPGDNVLQYLKDVIKDMVLTINRKHPTMTVTTGQILSKNGGGEEVATLSIVTDQAKNTDEDESESSYFYELKKRMENI